MRKTSALIASYLLKGYMQAFKSEFRLVQMRSYHLREAAQVLSKQFCEYEPLCHALEIKAEEIYDFFYEQVSFSAQKGLGVVIEHSSGQVVGAMTIEDHKDQMPINPERLSPRIALIGQILDAIKLPPELEPETCGEVYYCGIGAVDSAFRSQNLLRIILIGSYVRMVAKGYKVGYAKISSPAVLKTMSRIERSLPFKFFSLEKAKRSQEIAELAPFNLPNFKISLMHWGVGRYQGQPLEVIA